MRCVIEQSQSYSMARYLRTWYEILPWSRLCCCAGREEPLFVLLSLGILWVVVKSPPTQFAFILERTSCSLFPSGFLQRTNPAKQTSSPSLIKWQRAIEHGDCPSCPFHLACEAELESWQFLEMMTSYKNIQFRSSFKLLMPSLTKIFMFLP